MAGCAAAAELEAAGLRPVVLEARARPGGRIFTDLSMGFPLDLGAAWLHGAAANPLSRLVEGRPYRDNDVLDNWLYDPEGNLIPPELSRAVQEASLEMACLALELAAASPEPWSMAEAVAQACFHGGTASHRRSLVRAMPLADLRSFAARPDPEAGPPLEGQDRFLLEGLKEVLARPSDLRLETEVQAVRWSSTGVLLETSSGPLAFDRVILTLPLGVLRSGRVRFEPALPLGKREAIDALAVEVLEKVALLFPRCSWPAEPDFLSLNEPDGEMLTCFNLVPNLDKPALVCFLVGDRARRHGPDDARELALTALRRAFPDLDEPVATRVSRWGTDPFSLGSFCLRPPGVDPGMLDRLAEPVGPLGFAGEATSRSYPGTVYGAYLSGLREARRLLASGGERSNTVGLARS